MAPSEKCIAPKSWDTSAMQISMAPGSTKKFRTTAWKAQLTFEMPSKDLHTFVAGIISAVPQIRSAQLTIYTSVFEPKHLIALLHMHSLSGDFKRDRCIVATGESEASPLLEAGLQGAALDFIFVPDPKPFSIYADHDGYITFFAQTRSNLNRVVGPLHQHGFKSVEGWERRF